MSLTNEGTASSFSLFRVLCNYFSAFDAGYVIQTLLYAEVNVFSCFPSAPQPVGAPCVEGDRLGSEPHHLNISAWSDNRLGEFPN